jgi:cell division transport system permease protein
MTFKLALKHLASRPFSSVFTVFAVAVSLAVLGTFWTVVENLERVRVSKASVTTTETAPGLTVFVDSKLSKDETDALREKILADARFSSVDVVAPEAALKALEQQFGETLSKVFEGNSLPVTLKLQFARSTLRGEELNVVLNTLRGYPGVLDVDAGLAAVPAAKDSSYDRLFSWATALLFIVFAVVALLVSHLIRLAFEALRPEVETMKVLGASAFWILRPLLLEGLVLGALGALLALGLLLVGVDVVVPRVAASLLPKDFVFESLSAISSAQLIGLGVAASMVGACFTWPLVARPAEAP